MRLLAPALALCVCLLLAQTVVAQNFSVDVGQSDTFGGFPPPDDVLAPGFPPGPVLVGGVAGANVDAFSFNSLGPTPEDATFAPVFHFSVDLFAVGAAGTALATEAAATEAETDVFESFATGTNALLHDGDGSTPGLSVALGLAEGGAASVGGVNGYDSSMTGPPLVGGVYWSVDAPTVTGTSTYTGTSAADVFTGGYAAGPIVFASEAMLGLAPGDELDALQVYDRGSIGAFDTADFVLFSLDPGSPSLATLGVAPGDVLISAGGGIGFLGVLVPDVALGLSPGDDLNALSVIPEPGSMMMIVGLGVCVLMRRRR